MGYKVKDLLNVLDKIDKNKMVYCYVPTLSSRKPIEAMCPISAIKEHEDIVELEYVKLAYNGGKNIAPSIKISTMIEVLKEIDEKKQIRYCINGKMKTLDPLIGVNEYPELVELHFELGF